MQWLVFGLCVWSGIEGWVCLRNLGLGATQRDLDGWISSQQPQKSTGKGSQGLRDCEVEKGLITSVKCVWVLVLGEDPGFYTFIFQPTKRPIVLALSATTYEHVTVSPETTMGCHKIKFLQAEEGYYCTFSF